MPSVLFLCSGNSARSQMAEGFLKSLLGENCEIESAGTEPKTVHPLAVLAMKEVGIDISKHKSKSVGVFSGREFDYVTTVCSQARERCPFLSAKVKRIHWELQDPASAEGSDEEKLQVFRKVRDEIVERIKKFLSEEINFESKGEKRHGSFSG